MKRLWAVSALLCTVGQFAHAGDYFLTGAQKKELVVRVMDLSDLHCGEVEELRSVH